MSTPATESREMWTMSAEYLIGCVLSLLIAVYLVYALVRPERF